MSTYSVDTQHGDSIAEGLNERQARDRAPAWSKQHGEPCAVYLVALKREDECAEEYAQRTASELVYPPVSDEQIRALQTEAAQAGDFAQVAICKAALKGATRSAAICAQVIYDARVAS